MAQALTPEALVLACEDEGYDAGITMWASLSPLAGPGAPVKPATYEGGRFQEDMRWWGEGEDRRPTKAIVIDNTASQANRLEAALERLRSELGLPEIVLDLSRISGLPPHLPRRLSSFRFPHRQADAYLRDAMTNSEAPKPFPKHDVGKALFDATADRADSLLQWFPQALLFGFWQSHLGKKRSQAKLARCWSSEIVGFDPATIETRQFALKGDPLNLTAEEQVEYDEDDLLSGWQFVAGSKRSGTKKSKDSLSEIGHGQALANPGAPAPVSFRAIEQRATVSFASLRRVRTEASASAASARALLVSLGLVAHVSAFGRPFSLRSGCDLRPAIRRWVWLGGASDQDVEPPDLEAAVELFRGCVKVAERAGHPVGEAWARDPMILQSGPELQKVIRAAYPLEG